MNETAVGALVGGGAGLLAGIVGELVVLVIAALFPTDVLIVGFALMWALPLGILLGAVGGWRGWSGTRYRLGAVAAAPGLLAGVVAALMQWSAV